MLVRPLVRMKFLNASGLRLDVFLFVYGIQN